MLPSTTASQLINRFCKSGQRAFPALGRYMFIVWTVLAATSFQTADSATIDNFLLRNFEIGGEFTLTNQFGGKTSLEKLRGKVVLLSFGYTHCPDVCPTTMVDFGKVLRALGDKAQSVQGVFITVDPARDNPQRLKSYLANFHERLLGLTGTVEELTTVANLYSSRFGREEPGPDASYSVGHTTFIFILDRTGKTRYAFPYNIGSRMVLEGVESLLDGKA